MKNKIKKLLCFFNIHDFYFKDKNGGIICENKCYSCGKYESR